ncbi:hypothetical protein SAMN05444338_103129 [Flavobacterium degerlachei]|jgi:REP element-mobilizing transposase RayT|uniref:Transposase IS200-like domain-containing protein n=2 Tax=Flavobacterium degerlachei TaxID=229203 RepID=A0A1H2UCP7_9FLAO|nr:hypothetical protein SAMN05444338_103129 [Flavobacterium degerlachei]
MALFKNKYQVESNRLKNWDYSSEAIYFITLVTTDRACVFGAIDNDKMILNDNGKIVETELLRSIAIRERWLFHNWIIMPNHIHLLVEILDTHNVETHNVETHNVETHNVETHNVETHNVETHCSASLQSESESESESEAESESESPKLFRKPNSISSFVAIFKSVTTTKINSQRRDAQGIDARRDALQCVSTGKQNKIWQSNYHDHIVRNYNSFDKIYFYIKNNPKNWNQDSINPN